ncbi:MAG: response regulator transcription factor [Chloroflexota bacterium]
MTIRIALVDDHAMVVQGLEAALSTFEVLDIVSRGGTVSEARELLGRDDIDVILLDVRLEDGNGLQVLAEREARERPRVLVISSFKATQYSAAAARFGASGFLLKSVPLPALFEAIQVIAEGGTVFSAEHLEGRFVTLTPRQREILRLTMDGLSNKEIGARIGLHRKTVEAHLSEVFEKYGIHGGRIELSIRAAEEGWLDIQPPDKGGRRGSTKGLPKGPPGAS